MLQGVLALDQEVGSILQVLPVIPSPHIIHDPIMNLLRNLLVYLHLQLQALVVFPSFKVEQVFLEGLLGLGLLPLPDKVGVLLVPTALIVFTALGLKRLLDISSRSHVYTWSSACDCSLYSQCRCCTWDSC